ncbi:MAG: hypothetical protein HGA38_00770 [Candidatus Moranbacteria bacterium]|nr:hypothetical protein [Candidatus Moranbacteria bacterium]NTW45545.1 hypothetical protein [Candidatus Moranbacteria bacterium]
MNASADNRNGSGIIRFFRADTAPVTFVIASFVVASGILFFLVDRGLDPDLNKDWWTLSFETRDQSSLSFRITNHSSASRFEYVVSDPIGTVDSGSVTTDKGSESLITVPTPAGSGRTTVIVTPENGMPKSVYRERP